MAIRQALAAATNITYKILFNDAVAMTGGQPVDGQITVPAIANQVRAEGVQRIAISDEPEKYTDRGRRNRCGNHRRIAHLEGKGASVLDFMGFAQKGGTVLSYVRLAPTPHDLNQVRIDTGTANALIACDMVVGTSEKVMRTLRKGLTRIVVNEEEISTADHVLFRDADTESERRIRLLRTAVGNEHLSSIDANHMAETLMGNTVFSNMLVLGYAWQKGLVPLSLAALQRATKLNGVAVEKNLTAFSWGRIAAENPDYVNEALQQAEGLVRRTAPLTLEEQYEFLTRYQDKNYADQFMATLKDFSDLQSSSSKEKKELHTAIRNNLFKLMAYKDEYEVARLYAETDFADQVKKQFEGDYTINFNLAPPLLARKKDGAGRPKKMRFGPWMFQAFKVLAKFRRLRGTPFDIFGYSHDRKVERKVLAEYLRILETIKSNLSEEKMPVVLELAKLPESVRGYGPVKDAAVAELESKREELLEALTSEAQSDRMALAS